MNVVWRDAFGYEDRYLASSNGDIRHKTPRRGVGNLKAYSGACTHGYSRVCICRKNADGTFKRSRSELVHRLIWQSFNGPIPEGLVINHKNGIKSDNRLCNLEAVTPSQNAKHAFDTLGRVHPLRGSKNNHAVLTEENVTEIRKRIAKGESKDKLALEYGVTRMAVWNLHWRKSWAHIP
ncbi:MAG: HNH endonuclease [Alphaproteobacteria bacterium]